MCPSSSSPQWLCGDMPAMDGQWQSSEPEPVNQKHVLVSFEKLEHASGYTLVIYLSYAYKQTFIFYRAILIYIYIFRHFSLIKLCRHKMLKTALSQKNYAVLKNKISDYNF